MSIPLSPDDISSDWLCGILYKQSIIPKGVTIIHMERLYIDPDLSYVSNICKIKLYFSGVKLEPLTIVVKFSATDETLLNSVKYSKLYERERLFYLKIQKRLDILTPHYLWSYLDEDSYRQILIMESVEDREVYTREEGCPPDSVPSVLKVMAHLHAHFWNRLDYEWLKEVPEYFELYDVINIMKDFNSVWSEFKEKFGDTLPKEFDMLQQIPWQEYVRLMDHIYNKHPRTLLHGDCKLDNMFFLNKGGKRELMLMDWQLMEKGKSVIDLTYFLVENLTISNRRIYEDSFIHLYHRYLAAEGVSDYSYMELYRDYKIYLIHRFGLIMYEILRLPFTKKIIDFEINVLLPRIIDAMMEHRVWEYEL